MRYANEIEQYIFNCLKKFNPLLRAYKEDARQEIRYAILVASSEKEAILLSNRLCKKMLRQYGYTSERAKETHKERCLAAQYVEESDNDTLEEIGRLYAAGCPADEICRRFGAQYDKKINSLLISAFSGGGGV
ncbi:MAG: hypothetical protein LBB85_11745 [Dysgonamonadaceae bacterium]|jgi:hypothetical protein|nr:hypothetical protein [Dysgonamonadaceae bacterium]